MPLPSGPVGGPLAQGADVSKYEPNIDWAQASGAGGLSFAIARVSDGTRHPDATFATNWAGMQVQGMVRGVYQFFRASQDPVAQADYLVAQVGSIGPGDLPPFADVETLDGVSVSQNVTNLRTWCDRIKSQLGVTPAIYTSRRVWRLLSNPTNFGDLDLWVANWGVSSPALPSQWKDWQFWQFTDAATIAGIPGSPGVDADEFHGTVDDLKAYAGQAPSSTFFRGIAVDSTGQGYWTCALDGGVFVYGDATFRGTGGGQTYPQPILGMERTPSGLGYWLFGADGNVLPFGDAADHGNLTGQSLAAPIVGMASTPTGLGYWLLGQDGSVFGFGDASSSLGQASTNGAVGIAATPDGHGYWIAMADGTVTPFGSAVHHGNATASHPVVGIASTGTGDGYWLAEASGAVDAFGDAGNFVYSGSASTRASMVAITPTTTGHGYWLLAGDGTVFSFGDAADGGARPR